MWASMLAGSLLTRVLLRRKHTTQVMCINRMEWTDCKVVMVTVWW